MSKSISNENLNIDKFLKIQKTIWSDWGTITYQIILPKMKFCHVNVFFKHEWLSLKNLSGETPTKKNTTD